jgi:hypothetical protein
MPALQLRVHLAVLLGYTCVALLFAWPLPVHLSDALLGDPQGDTGVYIWNLWVFRHEIVVHHAFPFLTHEILTLDPAAVPLSLHNYTTFADVLAFLLLGAFDLVTVFNLITIGSTLMAAYAMFLFANRRTGDAGGAFLGGLLFGFSPYMSARASAHFSLVQVAPMPIFGLVLFGMWRRPTLRLAAVAGVVMAWAFLSDPYYAVYCLMMLMVMVGHSLATLERRPAAIRSVWWRMVLDLLILSLAGLVVGIAIRGGGRLELFGLRLSMTRLYTPVLLLTLLLAVRVWLVVRLKFSWRAPFKFSYLRTAVVGAFACAVMLSPVLYAMVTPQAGRPWRGPRILWRSSAPGVDLASWLTPNPLHPLWGSGQDSWLARLPNGFDENVASFSLIALAVIVFAIVRAGFRGPLGWWIFTAIFACLSLGPFVSVAGVNTYVPTPWAVLRYLPIIGAARMPTRMTILVMLGLSMLFAMAVAHLRSRMARPRLTVACIAVLLIFELLPAPRQVFSAAVPEVHRIIRNDPAPVRVMNLPFGLKDGLSERGAFSARYQYFQTVHEKRLIGGYISRLPDDAIPRYRQHPLVRVLLRLSEARPLEPGMEEEALAAAPEFVHRMQLGYVVLDTGLCSPELVAFVKKAFPMSLVLTEGPWELYRTPFASDAVARGDP